MRNTLTTTLVLITTMISFAQVEEPKEKTEIKENPEWTIIPKWYNYENTDHFHFIKTATSKLETCDDGLKAFLKDFENVNYEKLISKTEEEQNKYFELAKKNYLGATILSTPNDTIGTYIKLNDIPDTDKFALVAWASIEPRYYIIKSEKKEKINPFSGAKDGIYYDITQTTPYFYKDDAFYNIGIDIKKKVLIQNLKTKQYYIVNNKALNFSYQECENLNFYAPSSIYKTIPKEMSQSEKELLARYKTLIKNGDAYIDVLSAIEKKYLTRGHFDRLRVNAIDKKTYNQKLENLKVIAGKLQEIDRVDDKNNVAQDKLTMSELGSLQNINNWYFNAIKF